MNTPSAKRFRNSSTDTDDISFDSTQVGSLLANINHTLSSLNARINLIELLHKEIQGLRENLEFSQEPITIVIKSNKTLDSQLSQVTKENKEMKETILDLQARSMRDNLVSSGIPENMGKILKRHLWTSCKHTSDCRRKNQTDHFSVAASPHAPPPYLLATLDT